MTYVRAESTTKPWMRSDFFETHLDGTDEIVSRCPLPKMLILSEDIVVGLAGEDPRGGLSNLLTMWQDCDSDKELRNLIQEDGDSRRSYLLLNSQGEIWKFAENGWNGPQKYGWIGDAKTAKKLNPNPWSCEHKEESDEQKTMKEQIGPEMAIQHAIQTGSDVTGGFMLESRIVANKFTFQKQTLSKVHGNPAVRSKEQALKALLIPNMSFAHCTRSASETYPATLEIEFLGSKVYFQPCIKYGYRFRHETVEREEQEHLIFDANINKITISLSTDL